MIFSFLLFSFRWSVYKGFLDRRYGFSVTFLTRVPFDPGLYFVVIVENSVRFFSRLVSLIKIHVRRLVFQSVFETSQ